MRRFALPSLATLAVGGGLLAQLAAAPYALWLANGAWTGAALFAVLALLRACRRIDDAEQRRPWAHLLAACWCWLAGQVAWDVLTATGVALPFPSLPDLGWLLFAPVALAGVYRLTPASVGAKTISALDALAVAVVTGAVVGVFHYDNASRSELSDAGIAIALAYAVLHSAVAATIVQSLCTRLSSTCSGRSGWSRSARVRYGRSARHPLRRPPSTTFACAASCPPSPQSGCRSS